MSPGADRGKAEHLLKDYNSFTWVSSSDAHYLEDLGKRTTSFFIEKPTIAEISSAMQNIDGRKVEWE